MLLFEKRNGNKFYSLQVPYIILLMGIFSKIFKPSKPDPRSQQEIDEQIVIIDNITRGN
jgi:hypothetical protein